MTKTEQKRLTRELRAEASAFIVGLSETGFSTEAAKNAWLADRLGNIDGISALLRESIGEEF